MFPGPSVYDDRLTFPQGWRGSVKTRHFVMALRDYYQEKCNTGEQADKVKAAEDAWAVTHINVVRLQPISEAFDDDSSGFVTVNPCSSLFSMSFNE